MATLVAEALGVAFCASGGCRLATQLCCCVARGAVPAQHRVTRRFAQLCHLFIIFASSILALVLFHYGDKISFLQDVEAIRNVCTDKGQDLVSQCYGVGAVLRISLGLTCYFVLMTLTAFSEGAFTGCWALKILVWLGCLASSFFVPSPNVAQFAKASQVCSILFLLSMVILLIDAAYHAQDYVSKKLDAEEESGRGGGCSGWRILYLLVSLGSITAAITGIGVLYNFSINHTPAGASCDHNIAFLTVTLVSGVLGLVLSPLQCAGGQSRGILTPALVFGYNTWLCWSAISSQPGECNPNPTNNDNGTTASVVGMLIAALSLFYTAFSASRSLPGLFASHRGEEEGQGHREGGYVAGGSGRRGVEEDDDDAHYRPLWSASQAAAVGGADPSFGSSAPRLVDGAGAAKGSLQAGGDAHYRMLDEDEEEEEGRKRGGSGRRNGTSGVSSSRAPVYRKGPSLVFFLVMVLASLYMGMVVSNWSVSPDEQQEKSTATMWVQEASQWATVALYTWTLVAPALCPNRDFS